MPRVNAHSPGDDIYEQYGLTQKFELASTQAAKKGELLTMNADGRLVSMTAASGAINNLQGIFQPKADVAAQTVASGGKFPTVECLMRGAFMLFKAPVNAVPGERVKISTPANATVDPDKVELSNAVPTIDVLGTIYEIYTKTTTGGKKLKTADDDLVVVQTGVI